MYIGDYKLAAVIYHKFTTRSFTTGAPTTLAGTPVISIYKDDDTTQTTTGVTLTVDFDGVTGLHTIKVDTSNAFYATGTNFDAIITTGTVGGVSVVGETIFSFSINKVSSLRPTTADRTLDVTATGEAGIDWANVGAPTTALDLSGTTIKTTQVVGSVTGAVGSVTGAVGSVTGAVGSVTGNVGGNVTGSVGSVVGAVGSVTGLTAANLDATISSRATPAQILTTALTEAYAADGVAPTMAQLLFGLQAFLQERSVSGVTVTSKKLDGSTTAMTFTLNDATTPTSITRAT